MGSTDIPSETHELAYKDHPNCPPLHISYGLPFTVACAKHVSETFKAQRAYIIASTSLSKQTKHVTELENALSTSHVGTWTGVRPHTIFDDLIPIINDMRDKKADLLITIGGCSLVDGAKIIIYALANNVRTMQDMEAMLEPTEADKKLAGGHFRDKTSIGNAPSIPMVFLPTTLSASEYTRFGGGTSSTTHLKTILTHPQMYAGVVILAPELAITTPEWVWLSTGVRAIDHCVEAYCSVDCPASIRTSSARALSLLIPGLLKSKLTPKDLNARLACHLAAKDSAMMLLYMPDRLLGGASHGIGHQLGPLGVGHGETSCILLPAVCKYNASVTRSEQETLRKVLWDCDPEVRAMFVAAGLDETQSDLGDALDVVFRALGMPRSLREKGVGRDKFEVLATNALRDPCCVVNPRPLLEKEQVLEILEMVLG